MRIRQRALPVIAAAGIGLATITTAGVAGAGIAGAQTTGSAFAVPEGTLSEGSVDVLGAGFRALLRALGVPPCPRFEAICVPN